MKKQLKQLLLVNSFFLFAMNMFSPLYAVFIQKIDSAIYHVGGIWSFYILTVGILTLIIRNYENHQKYADYFLILGFICRLIGWTSYVFATSLIHLYLIQIIMALGESFGTPSYNLIYSSFLTKGKYASDWGFNSALSSFVMAGAAFLGGIIVHNFGFNYLFYTMMGFSIVSIFFAISFRKSFS